MVGSLLRWLVPFALSSGLLAGAGAAGSGALQRLPHEVEAALQRAKVPADALVVVVQDAVSAAPRLRWQAQLPVNPASLTKLVTTYAALDLLGPAWTWITPVWLDGSVHDGVLEGNLVIKGNGDPKLVLERLWLLLRRVQQTGVREIRGDIVLDRSAFLGPEPAPESFDGEPLRPYNVAADALLLNYRAVMITLAAGADGQASVLTEPPLASVALEAPVVLSAAPCDDQWRRGLTLDFADPDVLRLGGAFPAACGEKQWPVAYPEPHSYNARLLAGLWAELGGTLDGVVRDGQSPLTRPSFELRSPTLAELVRDVNKFSNNVMAQQLFLSLGLTYAGSGSPQAARAVLQQWLLEHVGEAGRTAVFDNGSGLSRDTRLSAEAFARLLQHAWTSPVMPELVSSLPLLGVDGTLRRSRAPQGRAHLKTGSLRDVIGVAGYVLGDSGRRQVLVAIINHPNAQAARPALDALVQWATEDLRPAR